MIASNSKKHTNTLRRQAQFVLFTSSYTPLFLLIIIKQITNNVEYLFWSGFNAEGVLTYIEKFGLSSVLIILSLYGIYGTVKTLGNVERRAIDNGFPVFITEVKNRNSESINYIATYIIPFAFQNFDSWLELFSTLVILIIIYRIFINSTLLLVNPVLSFWYGLYEIEFSEGGKMKKGVVITKDQYLVEKDGVLLYPIGHKMYFAINNEQHDTQ